MEIGLINRNLKFCYLSHINYLRWFDKRKKCLFF